MSKKQYYRLVTNERKINMKTLLSKYDQGLIFNWERIQRKPTGMSLKVMQDVIVATLNGYPWGTPIALVDMHDCINYCEHIPEDLKIYQEALKEAQNICPQANQAVAEGAHRLQIYSSFNKDKIPLREGQILIPKYSDRGVLLVEEGMFLSDLGDYWKEEYLNYEGTARIHSGRFEDIQQQVNYYNAMKPKTRAELRQNFAGSVASDHAFNMQKKYYSKVATINPKNLSIKSKVMSVGNIKGGGLQDLWSRLHHYNVEGTEKDANPDALDKLHVRDIKTNRTIDNLKYKQTDAAYDLTMEVCLIAGNVLRPANKKSVNGARWTGLGIANLELTRRKIHNARFKVLNLDEWAKRFAAADDNMMENVKTDKNRKDFSDTASWEQHQREENYSYWVGQPHVGLYTDKRVKAIRKWLKENLEQLLKDGVLTMYSQDKAYASDKQKRILRERQENLDPITGEKLLSDAEGHHKKHQRYGGLTKIENLVLLNKPTHKHISDDDKWKNASWESILDNTNIIKKELQRVGC